jgi:hypothetical protein
MVPPSAQRPTLLVPSTQASNLAIYNQPVVPTVQQNTLPIHHSTLHHAAYNPNYPAPMQPFNIQQPISQVISPQQQTLFQRQLPPSPFLPTTNSMMSLAQQQQPNLSFLNNNHLASFPLQSSGSSSIQQLSFPLQPSPLQQPLPYSNSTPTFATNNNSVVSSLSTAPPQLQQLQSGLANSSDAAFLLELDEFLHNGQKENHPF